MSDTRNSGDCARADRLTEQSIEGAVDDRSADWLEAHRQVCPACASVASALGGSGDLWAALDPDQPTAPPGSLPCREQVLAHLGGEPVEAIPLDGRSRLLVLLLSISAVTLVLGVLGVRADVGSQPWYFVAAPVVVLLGGFVVALVSFDRLRDSRRLQAMSVLLLFVLPVFFSIVALTIRPTPHNHLMSAIVGPALGCGSVGLLVGLSALVPAIFLARRGMSGPSRLGALLLGTTAAAFGVGTLHMQCSLIALPHLFLGHGLLFLTLPVAALLLRSSRRLA